MFNVKRSFSGFSVDDLREAKEFYGETLGLSVNAEGEMGFMLRLPGGNVFVYPKEDHRPATFTVLNFEVDDIDDAMDELTSRGIRFEHYEEMPVDERGVLRGISMNRGPDIAWFTDPAGNVLSVLQVGKGDR